MCKRHEEAAAAKADLSAAAEKDQKHEGEQPGRPRTGSAWRRKRLLRDVSVCGFAGSYVS